MKKGANKRAQLIPARWNQKGHGRVLGVVMIVKDEAENLPDLFASIREVADEVVVVDTGSTDGTRAVCKAWGVTLLNDPWRDDFSRARNRSLHAAATKFVLWMDADDRLPSRTQQALVRMRDEVLPSSEPKAFDFEVQNVDAHGKVRDVFHQPRLLPRIQGLRFQNAVHEEVVTSLSRLGIEREEIGLALVHTGYSSYDQVKAKHARNETILRRSIALEGPSVHSLVHLALAVMESGKAQEAEEYLTRAIEIEEAAKERPELLAETYTLRGTLVLSRGDRVGATIDFERAIELHPTWAVPLGRIAEVYAQDQDWQGVMEAVDAARSRSFRVGVLGFGGRAAESGLERVAAFALQQQGRVAEAEACLRNAVAVDPYAVEARLDLGHILMESEKYEDAREVLEPAGEDESALERFVDVASSIGLARAMTGDMEGASACLAPLLDVFAEQLNGASDVGPMDLADVMLRTGHSRAAGYMVTLFQKTMAETA